uniref:Putative conserved secreted protein n=2 Tax=Culex tarsalis TaxID=7177 RepID=A0A1Q3FS51_CULTA
MNLLLLVTTIVSLALGCSSAPAQDSYERDSEQELEAVRRLRKTLEDSCESNSGSNATYGAMMEAVAQTPTCFGSKFELEELVNGWNRLSNATREQYFTTYCPVVKAGVQECLVPVEALGRLCMTSDAQRVEYPDFPMYLLPQVVDLLCEGHGEILFANNSKSPTKCFENYFTYMKQCMRNFVSETNAKPRGEFAEVECRVLERSRWCVLDKLTNCGNGDLIKVFDIPYRSVVEQTACRDFIKQS